MRKRSAKRALFVGCICSVLVGGVWLWMKLCGAIQQATFVPVDEAYDVARVLPSKDCETDDLAMDSVEDATTSALTAQSSSIFHDARVLTALAACQPFHDEGFHTTRRVRDLLVARCALATPIDTIDLKVRCRNEVAVQTLTTTYPALKKGRGRHTLVGTVRCHDILPLLQAPLEGVISFHFNPTVRLYNSAATSSRFLGTDATQGLGAYGLDGGGEIVAVLDTGISSGDINNNFHIDLKPAIYGMVAESTASRSIPIDLQGHGTHVCGSIVSQGTVNAKTRAGACGAALFAQGFYDETLGGPNVLPDAGLHFERGRLAGATIFSNSWGSSAYLYDWVSYGMEAQVVDAFVWNNPEAFVCFAIGNDGEDANRDERSDPCTVLSFECYAKNILTVGAQESYRTDDAWTYNDLYIETLPQRLANDLLTQPYDRQNDGMALFSSRGPLTDGRVAPMIVAPGTEIVSTSNQSYAATATKNGTSMATPHVAASAAILRQYLREYQSLSRPTAALMRAGLILCADSLYPGQYGIDNPEVPNVSPNNVEGWGALHLGKYLVGVTKEGTKEEPQTLGFHDRIVLNSASESDVFTFTTSAVDDVCIVLSWIDYYDISYDASPLCNDYDLTVKAPDGTIYTLADHLNPIERIHIPNAPIGTYTITVSATRIAKTGKGNLAAIAWRATTAIPAPIVKKRDPVSEKTCTLTVKHPEGVADLYPLWPTPGVHTFTRGETFVPFAGPRMAMSYDPLWGDENGHILSHLAGWILFDANGRPVRQHFPAFETVLVQPYDYGIYDNNYASRLSQTLNGLAQPPETPIVLDGEAYTLQWYECFPGYGIRLK